MQHWIKWILGITSLLLLGVGTYFLVSSEKEAAVFEQMNQGEEEDLEEETSTLESPDLASPTTLPFIEVLPSDCNNECTAFQTSPDQYAYCRSVCGLSADPLRPTPQPTDPKLQKDIERKNEAIKESDLSKCEAITDTSLRKSCQARVTEDLLE